EGETAKMAEIVKKDKLHAGLLNIKAYNLIRQRKFENIDEILENAKKYSGLHDPYNYLLTKANELLYLYYAKKLDEISEKINDLEEAFNETRRTFQGNQAIKKYLYNPLILGKSILISLERRRGNLEKGIEIGYELIKQARDTNNRYLLNRVLNNTALCLIESGNIRKGLVFLEEAFDFLEIIANSLQLAISANNIGFIHRSMGNLEKAMNYFYLALENATKAEVPSYIVAAETNIAHLHLDFDNPKLALSDSEKALETLEENEEEIPKTIKIALDLCRADIFEQLERYDDASAMLDHALMEISESDLTSETAKVYLRKARLSARQSNLGEATNFLESALEIAKNNNLFETIVNANLQLAEIDLLKYRMTNEEQLLDKALMKIAGSEQLCVEQEFMLILIDIYILQGLLLSLKERQKEGKRILEKAVSLSQDLNLKDKEQEARNQLKELQKEKKNLLVKIFTRINESIRKTISFESVAKPKEPTQQIRALFIISKDIGLPIYEQYFDEKERIDPNLLSGLLSAISTMGQTVLSSKEGGLRLIDHGDVSIMLETGEKMVIALVVGKETYLLRNKLQEFTTEMEQDTLFKNIDLGVVKKDEKTYEKITTKVKEKFDIE
ncbi:MAG: tetratricopeptide repeat protein, partial [Asgard group archaeon]|nr:tetratricopeptide repeat protein [Asgard group archaeon]